MTGMRREWPTCLALTPTRSGRHASVKMPTDDRIAWASSSLRPKPSGIAPAAHSFSSWAISTPCPTRWRCACYSASRGLRTHILGGLGRAKLLCRHSTLLHAATGATRGHPRSCKRRVSHFSHHSGAIYGPADTRLSRPPSLRVACACDCRSSDDV